MFIMSLLGGIVGMPVWGDSIKDIKSVFHPHLPEEMKEITLRHFNWYGEKFTVVLSNQKITIEREG
jgi:hypothetical protein